MSAVHQGGVGVPNELATFRVHDNVVISSNEAGEKHEITPRLIEDLLENFSVRCWPRSPREIILSGNWKVPQRKNYKIGPIDDRPGKVWLGSSGISNFGLSLSAV